MESTNPKESEGNSCESRKPEAVKKKRVAKCTVNRLNKAFLTYGPECPEEIATAMQGIALPLSLEAYVNNFAIRSEERVLERVQDSPEFVQCASWSELLASKGFRKTCNNEIPLALRTIAYTEKFPEPDNANGVDFQLLYLNLACMTMGQPVRPMNAATQTILKQVYEETVGQVLSKRNKNKDIALLKEKLIRVRKPTPTESKLENATNLDLFFSDPSINPLQLPMEMICSKRS